MMMRDIVAVAIAATVLGGCATTPRRVQAWSGPGATQQQFMRDREDCIKEAQEQNTALMSSGNGSVAGSRVTINVGIFTMCMGARDYSPDDNGKLAPPTEQ